MCVLTNNIIYNKSQIIVTLLLAIEEAQKILMLKQQIEKYK